MDYWKNLQSVAQLRDVETVYEYRAISNINAVTKSIWTFNWDQSKPNNITNRIPSEEIDES